MLVAKPRLAHFQMVMCSAIAVAMDLMRIVFWRAAASPNLACCTSVIAKDHSACSESHDM